MDNRRYKRYVLTGSNTSIEGIRRAPAYKPRPSVASRPTLNLEPDSSDKLVSQIVPNAAIKVFGFMQDHQIPRNQTDINSTISNQGTKNVQDDNKPAIKLSFKYNLKNFKYLRELRFFLSGATLALGLASFVYYGYLNRPLSKAENDNSSVVNEDGTKTYTTSSGETVNVSPGVNVNDVDTRPPKPIEPDMPSRLIIPKIRINAKVRSLGLTRDGTLAVPNYYNQVGWYEKSARPGNPGTVVLDGHYDATYDGTVFKNIDKLTNGDEIQILRGDGQVINYVIESKELFDKNAVPMDKLISGDGKERLHIITCFGEWIPREQTYTNRMMIFAIKK